MAEFVFLWNTEEVLSVCVPDSGRNPNGYLFQRQRILTREGAENAFHSPIPTQVVRMGNSIHHRRARSRGKLKPRVKELADTYGAKQGLDRRDFLKTSFWHGRRLPGHEQRLRQDVRCFGGRGRRCCHGHRTRRIPQEPVHLRRSDPLRAGTTTRRRAFLASCRKAPTSGRTVWIRTASRCT